MNRNNCPRCRRMMRVLALDYRAIKATAILRTAEAYRDQCYHRTPEQVAVEAAQLSHSRAVAALYDDGDERSAKKFSGSLTTLPTVESGLTLPIRSSQHLQHAATKTATIGAIVVGLTLALPGTTKAADGGQTISAGSGVVSVSVAGLKPPATSTGPADSISPATFSAFASATRPRAERMAFSGVRTPAGPQQGGVAGLIFVASGIDRKRPHSTEPWLSPDSEGAQSERAVSQARLDPPGIISPTENNVHLSSGFSRPASGPVRGDGVGNRNAQVSDTACPQPNAGGGTISPAVGGNRTDLRAQRGLREETGHLVPVQNAALGRASLGEQSALSDQSGGMPGTGPAAHLSRARNLASVAVAGNGATAVSIERRSEQNRTGVTAGETALFPRLLALAIVTGSAIAGLLAVASCALSGRLEDPR